MYVKVDSILHQEEASFCVIVEERIETMSCERVYKYESISEIVILVTLVFVSVWLLSFKVDGVSAKEEAHLGKISGISGERLTFTATESDGEKFLLIEAVSAKTSLQLRVTKGTWSKFRYDYEWGYRNRVVQCIAGHVGNLQGAKTDTYTDISASVDVTAENTLTVIIYATTKPLEKKEVTVKLDTHGTALLDNIIDKITDHFLQKKS